MTDTYNEVHISVDVVKERLEELEFLLRDPPKIVDGGKDRGNLASQQARIVVAELLRDPRLGPIVVQVLLDELLEPLLSEWPIAPSIEMCLPARFDGRDRRKEMAMLRRRPIARVAVGTAVVAGTAAAVGGHAARKQGAAAQAQQDAAAPVEEAPSEEATDPYEQLSKFGALHEQGILTDEEFAAEKAKILG